MVIKLSILENFSDGWKSSPSFRCPISDGDIDDHCGNVKGFKLGDTGTDI